jgi:uncharacterized protein with ATP-grasp and redox domains
MRTELACIPCILQQTIDTVELASSDEEIRKQAVDKILSYLKTVDYKVPPPILGKRVYEILHEVTGNPDPYKEIKIRYNDISMALYDDLRTIVLQNEDPINTAAKLAVAGNVIDFGVSNREVHVEQIIESIHSLSFSIDDFSLFITDLKKSKKIVYLADNAGEIVFDRLFVEMLQRFYPERGFDFTVVVRGAPIINDATMEDAEMIGLTSLAKVIGNGDNAPATDLSKVSAEMKNVYDESDIIISKGMGNYETLDLEDRLIYYLLKIKCPMIAKNIGAEEGSLVFKRNEDYKD